MTFTNDQLSKILPLLTSLAESHNDRFGYALARNIDSFSRALAPYKAWLNAYVRTHAVMENGQPVLDAKGNVRTSQTPADVLAQMEIAGEEQDVKIYTVPEDMFIEATQGMETKKLALLAWMIKDGG